jgi:hypothetical protein
MTKSKTASANSDAPPTAYPLFYKDPLLLRSEQHREAGIMPPKSFAFARSAAAMPLCLSEFAVAQRHYPIAFVEDETAAMPMALLALEQDQNLFVEGDGTWSAGTYVPAYVRRYPFIVLESPDKTQHMLMVDQASDRYITKAGNAKDAVRLFDEQGEPTPAAREAITFCEAYFADHTATMAFGKALKEAKVLTPSRANITFPDGKPHTVNGFSSVDEKALRELPAETVALWHKRGWLDLITLHLASRLSWQNLLDRRAARNPAKAA